MKKRRRLTLAVAVLAVAVGAGTCLCTAPREPSYAGHTLTEWLVLDMAPAPNPPPSPTPTEAIRHIGTNAIPCLLRWIDEHSSPPPARERAMLWVFDRLPKALTPKDPGRWTGSVLRYCRGELAPNGFRMLGPAAAPAVPKLENMACSTNTMKGGQAALATFALSMMGTQALPAIDRIAQDTNKIFVSWEFNSYREPEPSYQGRSLSEWVMRLGDYDDTSEPYRALKAIGTNAVPYLLTWVRYDPPQWEIASYNRMNEARRLLGKRPLYDRRQILANAAARALYCFSEDAHRIDAECKRLMLDTNTPMGVIGRILYLGQWAAHAHSSTKR